MKPLQAVRASDPPTPTLQPWEVAIALAVWVEVFWASMVRPPLPRFTTVAGVAVVPSINAWFVSVTMLMAGVLCFGLLVPLALQRHNNGLAIGVGVVFVAYLVANVLLWQRMRPRA